MTMKDLTPYLYGLTPDPVACESAHALGDKLPAMPLQDTKSLLMCFAYFHREHAAPGLPEGLSEAVGVLSFAASGLAVFLAGESPTAAETYERWATLARARLWAVSECRKAAESLTAPEVEALRLAVARPHWLPVWAADVRQAGKLREAGRCAMWHTVAHLLEVAPTLQDGEAEDLTAAVLMALMPTPAAHFPPPALELSSSPERVPGLADFVPTVQSVQALPGGRVRVEIQGGEGYEVGRSDCVYTPLPDGGALLNVFAGTPDARPLRLDPLEARQVFDLLGFDGEEESRPASTFN